MTHSKLWDIHTRRPVWVQLHVYHQIMQTPFEWMSPERRWHETIIRRHRKIHSWWYHSPEHLKESRYKKVADVQRLLGQSFRVIQCESCLGSGQAEFLKLGKDRKPCKDCAAYGIKPEHATAQDDLKLPPFSPRWRRRLPFEHE